MRRIASTLCAGAVLLCLSGFPLFGQMQQQPGNPGQPGNGNPSPTAPGQQQPSEPGQQPETGAPGTNNTSPKTMQQSASQMLSQNPKLVSELEPLLPSGTNVPAAAAGFTSLHKFVTAVHVSHNLQIPFGQLKTKAMSGNLSKAVRDIKPNMDHKSVKSQIKTASKQAKQDIKQSKS